MKSVVVEIKGDYAAILSDNGSIMKIKNQNYVIGQEIEMKRNKLHITKKLALFAACAAILFLSSGIGVWAYTTPYSYVSLDVNPSIEYTLNCFERVIDVKAVNEDGQVILDQINIAGLNNKSIETAILNTVQQISSDGYFSGGTDVVSGPAIEVGDDDGTEVKTVTGSAISIDGGIVITVSSGNSTMSDELAEEIRDVVDEFISENVKVEVYSVGLERVEEAKELGVTPGKLNLVEKLQASSDNPDSIVLEEWLNKPVKDIMKEIKKNRKTSTQDAAGTSTVVIETADSEVENGDTETADNDDTEALDNTQDLYLTKKAGKQAEKQAKEAEKQAEKQAKEAGKQAEKQAKEAEKQAEKQAKEAEKQAEKQAKEAGKQAEKQAKEAGKQVQENEKDRKALNNQDQAAKENTQNTENSVNTTKNNKKVKAQSPSQKATESSHSGSINQSENADVKQEITNSPKNKNSNSNSVKTKSQNSNDVKVNSNASKSQGNGNNSGKSK